MYVCVCVWCGVVCAIDLGMRACDGVSARVSVCAKRPARACAHEYDRASDARGGEARRDEDAGADFRGTQPMRKKALVIQTHHAPLSISHLWPVWPEDVLEDNVALTPFNCNTNLYRIF